MGDFFRGWRRKAGLATLAMALVLTVGWMRSVVVVDEIFVHPPVSLEHTGPRTYHTVRSQGGVVGWEQWTTDSGLVLISETYNTSFSSREVTASDSIDIPKGFIVVFNWRLKCCGIDLGSAFVDNKFGAFSNRHSIHCIVPYWLFVLPLTLLSAWLLLIKPRPAKSAKESSRA